MSIKRATDVRFQLRVTLVGLKPPVWRMLEVPGSITLGALHNVIQVAMGWGDEHLHMFVIGRGAKQRTCSPAGEAFLANEEDENTVFVQDVLYRKGSKLSYTYDFGDSWEHEIRVEKRFTEAIPSRTVVCLDGAGACPPEDSGGIWGYANKLKVMRNPKDPYSAEIAEWMGEDFDPLLFDKSRVDKVFSVWNKAAAPAR